MSELEDSGNNKISPPSSPSPQKEEEYVRSRDYYYEDGSTVFLAGKTLFKLQASLLKPDPGVSGYNFESDMENQVGELAANKPGSADTNPIILPLRTPTFEILLLAVLGRIGDSTYENLFTRANSPQNHSPKVLIEYLRVGVGASYFGMKKLESWTYSQVRLILGSSQSLASRRWSPGALRILTKYLQRSDTPECQRELLALLQLVISIGPTTVSAENNASNNLVCTEFYKNQDLPTTNPSLFGFLFVFILSLGHHSPVWRENLERDDRAILYAAHTDLTRLRHHSDLKTDWLWSSEIQGGLCSAPTCHEAFIRIWKKTFALCGPLDSPTALEDISRVLTLPQHRWTYVRNSSDWDCESGCAQKSLNQIDAFMRELFCGFARKHEVWTRDL